MQWTMVNAETHNWSKVIVESSVSDGLSVAHPASRFRDHLKKVIRVKGQGYQSGTLSSGPNRTECGTRELTVSVDA